ncbi:MAG: stage II sporulation protein M [Planctomycetaceae bacterium]|nr:stage II sporulation protein M [Planctomycetaceae bacterium]
MRQFVDAEQPYWQQLESMLGMLETDPAWRLVRVAQAFQPVSSEPVESQPGKAVPLDRLAAQIEQVRRLHYLYERASADLARLDTFCAEPQLRSYLEALVARAYAVIHATAAPRRRVRPLFWFLNTFPQTFRKHINAFWLSLAVSLGAALIGALLTAIDTQGKPTILPFAHLRGDPRDRVKDEEQKVQNPFGGHKSEAAGMYMTHNTRVSINTMALGITWGVGTILMLFYNGLVLGSVTLDYFRAGQGTFLVGWLLPHGSIELPAIFLAGQAGLVLGRAVIGWGDRHRLSARLKSIAPDLVTLIIGVAIMLVWAGLIEAFISQYHWPVLPYWAKITFGCLELSALVLLLGFSGRSAAGAGDV